MPLFELEPKKVGSLISSIEEGRQLNSGKSEALQKRVKGSLRRMKKTRVWGTPCLDFTQVSQGKRGRKEITQKSHIGTGKTAWQLVLL